MRTDPRKRLLGGLDANAFLRRHWQKQPLLVRGAIPGFEGLLDFATMIELASREDCESRLVTRHAERWSVEHGPFNPRRLRRLPRQNWTLLVQGIESVLPSARRLLSQFDFIPHARLDDLMVSHAPPGGGVGPHFDSYDVFLLQGPGQRRWRVGRQRDLSLVENSPLKILQRFVPDGECVLSAGDMLYLPPEFAHDGVAVDACYTYSIGFRAPTHRELVSRFLSHLEDGFEDERRYADPDLVRQDHPAKIGGAMIAKVDRILRSMDWTRRDIADFLGTYLTEPKPHVVFKRPARPLSGAAFAAAARRLGIALSPGSLMLHAGAKFFMNGEMQRLGPTGQEALRKFADNRRLSGRQLPPRGQAADILYRWYRDGYIELQVMRSKG
ncbi:MAG TPA: cupin domain-containing protein [Burkholderiales bacterium]|nr:cupin domain-containing protein [Burkholderiales bacterium]